MKLPLLSLLIFLPLTGVIFISLINGEKTSLARNARNVALRISVVMFALSLVLWFNFDPYNPEYQFIEKRAWIHRSNIYYYVGVDGISLFFVLLTTLLTPICILISWDSIQNRIREYMMAFLFLETLLIGMFCSLDLLLFYVFFEGTLIPMFLIIGIWGGERRIYACFKFFLYTLLGSVLMLLALIKLFSETGTADLQAAIDLTISFETQKWLWLAFFVSFAVKIPMWPFHTWLPDAHVEAPTAGSVILAGVLIKMGGYGFLRLTLPILPHASEYFAPFIFTLSVIAIIYISLITLVQKDLKKLIAYSSIAHMGFVTLGIFSLTHEGIAGSIVQMISHGLISAGLFLCVGFLYERFHTRDISAYVGLATLMPVFSAFFMILTLASIGLPGTSGFIGEFFVLLGIYQINTGFALLATSGLILSAAYMLWLYRRIIFGKLTVTTSDVKPVLDLNIREITCLSAVVIPILVIGIYPPVLLSVINPSVEKLLVRHNIVKVTAPPTKTVEKIPLKSLAKKSSKNT
jgi:NADH-quinone oxidoreductase subunit M